MNPDPPGLALADGTAAEVLLAANGATTAIVVEGGTRAVLVVAAMRARLGAHPTLEELAAAWRAGVVAAEGERLSALLLTIRDGRATIVHAGDLAAYAGGKVIAPPHTHWCAEAPLRIRTRAMNLPGPANEPALVDVDLGDATRIAIVSFGVWSALGDELATALAADGAPSAIAHAVQTASKPEAGTLCVVVVPVPPRQTVEQPAVVLTSAQRKVRRTVRATLARAVGPRAAAIVGGAGAGKTCVLEHLARAGVLDASCTLVTAAQLRRAAKASLPVVPPGVVALVDRLADAVGDDHAIAQTLADAIARGELALVTTGTRDDLATIARTHRILHDELVPIALDPPTADELLAIVTAWAPRLAARHRATIEPAAIPIAVSLSQRFAFGRAQPEAALFALEQACLRAGNSGIVTSTLGGRGGGVCDRAAVVAAIADQGGIALDLVEGDDDTRAAELAPRLAARLHGQHEAAALVAAAVARGVERRRAATAAQRPLASLLLLGPTGTGKTETARLLAECWYLGRHALTQIDLSEYKDAASATRLVGASPGYIGHGERPALATALAARPHQVILFDEIEKAHPEVLTLLLQILDEGRLTTGQGETLSFRDAIVVLTSNLLASSEPTSRVGFGPTRTPSSTEDRAALARELRPELVARVDAVVRYAPLAREAATAIALGYLARAADALIASGRLAPARLPVLRQQILAGLASTTTFDGGARALLRLVEETLIGERARVAKPAPIAILYPYLETGRERLAAGFVLELAPAHDAGSVAHEVLVHPAGAGLLYVAHTGARVIALTGDRGAADAIASDLAARATTPPITAQGRVRADLAGRPIGELIDRLLA